MAYKKRLIDANEVERKLKIAISSWMRDCNSNAPVIARAMEDALQRVIYAPTVDAVEVVHGRWAYNGRTDDYYCTNCFKQPISFRREMDCGVGELVEVCFSAYCPNCGAKMDGDGNG